MPTDPKSRPLTTRLSHDDYERVRAIAAAERRTLAQTCRLLILEGLAARDAASGESFTSPASPTRRKRTQASEPKNR